MRSIEYARAKGREARRAIDASPGGSLLDRLVELLENTYGLSLVPMRGARLRGGHAELNADSRTIKYDASLSDGERLMHFAHELGHLVLHGRLRDGDSRPDPLTASAYVSSGPSAIARYSPRTYEETQAEAFALELVAPADLVWQTWLERADANVGSLMKSFGCSADVIRTQLAHALYGAALGEGVPSASRKDVPFTPAQLAAAHFVGAPAIVDAGPGTGKTATVIERIRHLCAERGARPSEILALTFSNEAARELSERIAVTLGEDIADAVNVRTFHGFGMEFLHRHGHLAGYGRSFKLLDEDAQVELVHALLGHVPCDRLINLRAPLETATRVVEYINYCKERLYNPNLPSQNSQQEQFIGLYRAYENEKAQTGRIDFADLIAMPIRVLEQHAAVRATYALQYPWVIVDEFQDVTRATSRLVHALCGPTNPPWVVGDARQSIYQFLGAAPENVSAFATDFENARVFALDVNFRSSPPIVTAASQLATLMTQGENGASIFWRHPEQGAARSQDDARAVMIAEAASDAAEAEGVAARVSEWIERDGVSPGDVAVLARRHVDVRNVILELGRRGIKVQASGLLTAEGAAGTLAAALTLAEAPVASIPRLVFALGSGRCSVPELNATVTALLRGRHPEEQSLATASAEVADEVNALYESAHGQRDLADGFTALAAFLFDDSAYLRRILAMPDSAERAMALVEIVSVLSLATAYRAVHPHTTPAMSRLGFAERLRIRLTKTLPVPLAPRPRSDAVHVMTCHASKGLEFPCVAVVGQTLPAIEKTFDWLPPDIRPAVSREEAQADALLFVAVTRAKRAVVVSYPRQATAGTEGRGKRKTLVPLLARWRSAFSVPSTEWMVEAPVETQVVARNIWDVPLPGAIKASALDESVCPLLTYLETCVGARFPEASPALYPPFFAAVRKALRAVAGAAVHTGVAGADVWPSDEDALAVLEEHWRHGPWATHAHAAIYRAAAEKMVVGFARALGRMTGAGAFGSGVTTFDPAVVLSSGDGLDVHLDLVAQFRRPDGTIVAIAFRPESLGNDEGSLNWSDLPESKRSSIALLGAAQAGTTPYVYSGDDGRIYRYRWSKSAKSLPTLIAALDARRGSFARGDFSVEVTRYGCDRCRVRASCPQWIGALVKH